jgi:hypothetical protein
MRQHESAPETVSQALAFRDAAPVVRYEVDGVDRLVRVNDAWSSFATANGGLHLVAHRVIGRSLWDFIAGEATRQVYKSLLRRVRDGGHSRFAYRCDAPERRRFMEMTMTATPAGHVRFESRTLLVEHLAFAPPPATHVCPWCRCPQEPSARVDTGVPAASPSRRQALDPTHEICPTCVEAVMRSVAYDVASPDDPAAVHLLAV